MVSLFTTHAAIVFRIGTFDSNLSKPLFSRGPWWYILYTTIILASHRVSTFVSLVFREN
jgi:hypothetical protein